MIVCERTVLNAEWKFVEEWLLGSHVFLDSERIPPRIYCKENADTVLTVNVGKALGTTAIRLSTYPQANPCVPILFHSLHSKISPFLPSLRTPPKARLLTYSGSGGGGESGSQYTAIATLSTEMPFVDLVQAYDEQLSGIDGQLLDENIGDKSVLSTWQFSKKNKLWNASLSIDANPAQNGEYTLRLTMDEQVS